MPKRLWRWSRRRTIALGVVAVLLTVLFTQWQAAISRNRSIPDEPYRIAGNLYSVGSTGVTAFLLTGPEGHVLIDGGYPETASLIVGSMKKLGFDIRDVKVLLNSHAHFDHAGGLKALQDTSGAELLVSEGDADVMAAGGAWDRSFGPLRFLGVGRFPAPRVDRRLRDGDTVRVGSVVLVAHVTAGHTPGCTSWEFPVQDGERTLQAVSVCSLSLLPFMNVSGDSVLRAQFTRSFATLRALPVDIFLGSHGSFFDQARKGREQRAANGSVEPFLDRSGYMEYIARAERQVMGDGKQR
ncbi:MAG: subclass B3 metallo-beta-lactamase [Gemmatimonadaceae bacterium]|nr:subclass B3 metallo-beta-lactamase [Gemmatimonadaceae bacterium]